MTNISSCCGRAAGVIGIHVHALLLVRLATASWLTTCKSGGFAAVLSASASPHMLVLCLKLFVAMYFCCDMSACGLDQASDFVLGMMPADSVTDEPMQICWSVE